MLADDNKLSNKENVAEEDLGNKRSLNQKCFHTILRELDICAESGC